MGLRGSGFIESRLRVYRVKAQSFKRLLCWKGLRIESRKLRVEGEEELECSGARPTS